MRWQLDAASVAHAKHFGVTTSPTSFPDSTKSRSKLLIHGSDSSAFKTSSRSCCEPEISTRSLTPVFPEGFRPRILIETPYLLGISVIHRAGPLRRRSD